MNDRFKFRVWDIEDCSYICRNDFDDIWFDKDGELHIGMYSDFTQGIEDYTDQVIIEQCTGLKDKNGNLIYEGDIVEITIFGSIGSNGGYVDSDEIYKGAVVWDRDCFLVKTDTDTLLFPHSEDCIEIIGNIHEQAEQKDK